jgi:hypothetical protein
VIKIRQLLLPPAACLTCLCYDIILYVVRYYKRDIFLDAIEYYVIAVSQIMKIERNVRTHVSATGFECLPSWLRSTGH